MLNDDYFYVAASNNKNVLASINSNSNNIVNGQYANHSGGAAAASGTFASSLSNNYSNNNNNTNNGSSNGSGGAANGSVSSEVKLKLKNVILQKLDKQNNSANNNSFSQNNNSSAAEQNTRSNHNYLTESQNHSKSQQAHLLEIHQQQQQQQQHQLINHQQQHYLQQFCQQFNENNDSIVSNGNKPMNTQHMQLIEDLDENNLRRTNSEPNLKVKSALKDRLLEKRNLLNPFLAIKKGGQHQQKQQQQQHQQMANKQPTFNMAALNVSNSSAVSGGQFKNLSKLNLSSKKTLSPSCSMSSIPTLPSSVHTSSFSHSPAMPSLSSSSLSALPLGNHFQSQQNQLNESAILSALSALAAQTQHSNPEQQQLAIATAMAFLGNSNKLNNSTNQLFKQNQFSLPTKLTPNIQSQSFLDSLALAAAFVNHQSQMNSNSSSGSHEKLSSLSYPTLPHVAFNSSTKLTSSSNNNNNNNNNNNTNNIPRFGHTVHVEEENEMLLENELKIAAKMNDNQLIRSSMDEAGFSMMNEEDEENNEFEDNVEMADSEPQSNPFQHSHPAILHNLRNNILLNRSYSNYHQHHSNHSNSSHHHQLNHSRSNNSGSMHFNGLQGNQFFQQHQHQNNIDKAQQHLIMLQQQQELEELKHRQQQYHSNKISYFSDPHLLKSLEHASISSNANLNNESGKISSSKMKKASLLSSSKSDLFKSSASGASTSAAAAAGAASAVSLPMESLGPAEPDRVYRYTTGIVYDTAMLKHECTCNNPSNHLETADRIKAIWSRFKSRDLIDECEVVSTKICSISDLLLTHSEQYALIFGSDIETRPKLPKEYLQQYMMNVCLASCRGFALTYDQDNSWNEEHTPIACRVAIGSTYELASLVSTGKLKNGFAIVRPPGSHAEFNKPLLVFGLKNFSGSILIFFL